MADNTKKTTDVAERPEPGGLASQHGRTVIADTVVSKVAGMAAREVEGVYDLGGGGARMIGAMRSAVGASKSVEQGVSVEVGEKQAAVDIAIVAEYGVAIHKLGEAIRDNIIDAVQGMTGLEVTEVNVTVHDVHLPTEENDEDDEQPKRVQ